MYSVFIRCPFFQWKKVFAERFLLQRNWLNGKYDLRTYEGHNQGLVILNVATLSKNMNTSVNILQLITKMN